MNVMDVIGPVMVGPSSSHTAGAVRIGKVSRRLLGENVAAAHIGLYGSFLATGRGHGTDKAIIAGLLGMDVDDMAIPDAFDIARSIGMTFDFYDVDLGEDAHPNSAKLELTGVNGKELEIVASSIGGGRIVIQELDHLTAQDGEYRDDAALPLRPRRLRGHGAGMRPGGAGGGAQLAQKARRGFKGDVFKPFRGYCGRPD